jgi:Xaa-Pro aminopeptidase
MLLNKIRAKEKMLHYDLKALIATSRANVFYSSDLCPYGNCYVLLPCEQNIEPAIIAPISDVTPIVLMSTPWIKDIRYYGEFYIVTNEAKETLNNFELKLINAQKSWEMTKEKDPIAILIELLKERGIVKGNIGVDESFIPSWYLFLKRIKRSLPNIKVVRARNIFTEIRMIKTDEEIRRIKESIRITERAWETVLTETKLEMTEREFAVKFQNTIVSNGGKLSSWMNMYGPPIAFGRRTAFPDVAFPSDYKLKKGDIIRLDGGCGYMGYSCDIGRTAVVGKPDEKLMKIYNAILEGEQLAIKMAKSGVKVSSIFDAVIQRVRKKGIPDYKRHHAGHGYGIEGYEPPLIAPDDHAYLEEGMVLCVETPYYEVGWGGVICEDMIVITKHEPECLTKFSTELYVVK